MEVFPEMFMLEDILMMLFPALLSGLPSMAVGIAVYVLTAMALHTTARRRAIPHAWLAWVPVLNVWVLGSLSDQYRYVVKGQIKSRRKVLLILNLLTVLAAAAILVIAVVMAVNLATGAVYGVMDDDLFEDFLEPALTVAALAVPMAGMAVAALVIRYMALFDVYTSMDPGNNVLFLVLSILFRVTEPFFLFFNRNKDGGMPPRRDAAAREEPGYRGPSLRPEEEEPWEEKSYM